MYKVIIYGLANVFTRRNIEYFLDTESYEIIGYSDTYYTSDVIDGKNFIASKDLVNTEFDFILLAATTQLTRDHMRQHLLEHGIPSEKIIDLKLLVHMPLLDITYDLIGDIQRNYRGEEGLIFGLSYSARGILEQNLKIPFYDCSMSSLDLYYNYRIYEFMNKHGLLSNVKWTFLVFPYYYFDYDMSLSPAQYTGWRMYSLHRLNDWHNYRKVPYGIDYIENFRMFGNNFEKFYHWNKFQPQTDAVCRGKEMCLKGAEKRFFDNYEETVAENKQILLNFTQMLKERKIKTALIVPPIYLSGIDQESLYAINNKKEKFYSILEELDLCQAMLFDYSDKYFDHGEFFFDHAHLNTLGAKEFTKQINKDILNDQELI